MKEIPNFRAEVIKALYMETINKEEAKECLKRGFGKEEIPIFFDFPDKEMTPLKNYVLGLEKMGLITPIFRVENE